MNGPPFKMAALWPPRAYSSTPNFLSAEAVQSKSLSLAWLASQAEELEHQQFIALNGLHG